MITGTKLIAATRDDDLAVRHTLKSLTPAQKLNLIISVYDNLSIDPLNANRLVLGHLTKNAIGFINKSVVPIHRCLITHFGNDKKRFLEAYPTVPYATFYMKCTAAGKDYCVPKKK